MVSIPAMILAAPFARQQRSNFYENQAWLELSVLLIATEPATARLKRFPLRERQQVHVLPPDSALCVEAEDDCIRIHTPERSYLKTQCLSDLQDSLDPARFVRVHRSWLINLDHLRGLERQGKDQLQTLLVHGLRVPISHAGHERIKPLIQG